MTNDEPIDSYQLGSVTVIVVTFNSAHCIAEQALKLAAMPHILIVDNGSTDNIREQVTLHLPQAKLIELERNSGFGAANNIALKQIQTPFALLLNPDCLMQIKDIQCLLDAAQAFPAHAIFAPQVLRSNGSHEISYRMPMTHWPALTGPADAVCSVGFVTGAAMLIRCSLLVQTGCFDENFFLYYEDEDLCLRAFQVGCAPVLVPEARAVHNARRSVRDASKFGFPWRSEYIRGYHHAQSKIYFVAKHIGFAQAKQLRCKVLALAISSYPFRLLWPNPRYWVRQWGRIKGLLGYPVSSRT